MSQNIWLAFPALTALIIQIWIFFHSNKRNLIRKSRPLVLLYLCLLVICLIELGTYTAILPPSLLTMKLYYVASFMGQAGILIQSIRLSHVSFVNTAYLSNIVFALCIVLSMGLIFSDNFITGFEFISYSYTRTPGPYYWVIQLYLLSQISASFAFLIAASRNQHNNLDSKRSRVLLLAISPLLLLGFFVIPLMELGININVSVVYPTFTVYFLVVLIETERREALFAILMKLPFSEERKSYKQITDEIHDYLINTEICKINGIKNSSLKSLTASIENKIVDWAVGITNGSQVQAATLLGVSSSSVCRKKKR